MRVLIIGHRGQLGCDLQKEFASEDLVLADREELLVQDSAAVADFIEASRPELILNCSAFHLVDDCEEQVDLAFAVNVFGVRNLALAARKRDAVLVHFSTDYVYDGPQRTPYVETDPVCPKCIYGVSKAAGEIMLQCIWPKHFLFRVSGLYGYAGSRDKGTNFVFEQARINDEVWLPSYDETHLSGRLLFLKGNVNQINRYSDYRKFHAESKIISVEN